MLKIFLLGTFYIAEIGILGLILYGAKNETFTSEGAAALSLYVATLLGCAMLAVGIIL